MKRIVAAMLLLLAAVPATFAQELPSSQPGHLRAITPQTSEGAEAAAKQGDEGDDVRVIHVTDRLNSTPEAEAALQTFRTYKAAGRLPAAGKAASYQLADTSEFNVLVNISDPDSIRWDTQTFALKATSPIANVWVEAGQIRNGNVSEDEIEALKNALVDATPSGSINPSRGIIANNNDIFGDPPNYDGDGKVDVLLYDITEGVKEEDGCCVFGYVVYTDIYPQAAPDEGNQRDVLYIDTDPGLTGPHTNTLLSTAAHEYQHLIHYNYDIEELTFVNEGLSEWAEILNGYTARSPSYLSIPEELNTPLFEWRRDEPTSVLTLDYQRAGLFTAYIAEQVGPEAAGRIVRSTQTFAGGTTRPARGTEGYDAMLVPLGTSLEEIITDFHTANYLNNQAVDPRFGYTTGQYVTVHAARADVTDGRTSTSTVEAKGSVYPGGVQYLIWEQVSDFTLYFDVDAPAQELAALRAALRPRVLLRQGSTVTVEDLVPRQDPYAFAGEYDRITVVVPHVDPEDAEDIPFVYAASWGAQQQYTSEMVQYDDGTVALDSSGALEAYALDEGFRFANHFEVPEGAILSSVAVAPYYRNQFSNYDDLPGDAPRNFTLKVWGVQPDGTPGEELFSTVINDSRFNSGADLNFLDVNLNEHQDQLADLPSEVFIGIGNTGTDENYLVFGVTEYESENVSYLFFPPSHSSSGWAAFPDVTAGDEAVLENRVAPIRATFLVPAPVAVEGGEDLPTHLELDPNYPNPFNPTTTIAYRLPQTSEVRLTVYDVLGRRVATLLDGALQQAGRHALTVDATGWASGAYFYTLEAANQTRTGKMLLVK